MKKTSRRPANRIAAALMNFFGVAAILIFLLLAASLFLPLLLDVEYYHVVSGSMEPSIPVGSMIYVKEKDPESLEIGDVIVFRRNGIIVTHRITKNDRENQQFTTKGDNNASEDIQSVAYNDLIGKEIIHIPYLGMIGSAITTWPGKIMLVSLLVLGFLSLSIAEKI